MDKRARGVEYFVKALSTGEISAAQRLMPFLAAEVTYDTNTQPGQPVGREVFTGRHAVLEQIGGLWPATPGYSRTGWSDPEPDGDKLKVTTSGSVVLTFSFSDADEISHVLLDGGYGGVRAQDTETIPLAVKGLINNALANQTPLAVTYVDERGRPHTSLRGSTCVYSPTELAIWGPACRRRPAPGHRQEPMGFAALQRPSRRRHRQRNGQGAHRRRPRGAS